MGEYDFRDDQTTVYLWHDFNPNLKVSIADSIKEAAAKHSRNVGTMRPLPSWIQDGAVVSFQGGQAEVDSKYQRLKSHGVPMVGAWMQDWAGLKNYIEGTRLIWNW